MLHIPDFVLAVLVLVVLGAVVYLSQSASPPVALAAFGVLVPLAWAVHNRSGKK